MVARGYTDIQQGELVDTYARSAFEDTRRNAAKFGQRRRMGSRDAVDGGVVQHDIGRHPAFACDLGTPRLEGGVQARIGGVALAG